MELMVRNGDYLPDGKGGFLRAGENEELLQRVLWKLSIRRGSFPFLPELGSQLYRLTRQKASDRDSLARQYVTQALSGETELTVTGVETAQREGTLEVTVHLDWRGESLDVKLDLEG